MSSLEGVASKIARKHIKDHDKKPDFKTDLCLIVLDKDKVVKSVEILKDEAAKEKAPKDAKMDERISYARGPDRFCIVVATSDSIPTVLGISCLEYPSVFDDVM